MNYKLSISVFLMAASLSACSFNPFNNEIKARSSIPKEAVHYICDDKQTFYVHMLNNGQNAWLMQRDREINLPRIGESNRYQAASILLSIEGETATLTDGDSAVSVNCSAQTSE